VREQHAECYFAAPGLCIAAGIAEEFGDRVGDRSVELEEPAFVEDRRHHRGGDRFGERSETEDRGGGNVKTPTLWQTARPGWGARKIRFVDQLAEGFQRQEIAALGYRHRCGWESTIREGFACDRKSQGEAFVLPPEVGNKGMIHAFMLTTSSAARGVTGLVSAYQSALSRKGKVV
jgi:hypothetical protein